MSDGEKAPGATTPPDGVEVAGNTVAHGDAVAEGAVAVTRPDDAGKADAPAPRKKPPPPPWARPGRISGTALPYGLHLSNGVYGTANSIHIMTGGAYIFSMLVIALFVTYIEAWVCEQFVGLPLTAILLTAGGMIDSTAAMVWDVVLSMLPFVNFILILRISQLSGYHASEHKVVAAIERYGSLRYDQVVEMPRVHPRCGTVLLFGIIPALLLALPLAASNTLEGYAGAALVALVGWHYRYQTGFFVQNYFTTKPPTEKQLRTGIAAGERLLALWREDPTQTAPWLRMLWIRGLPQLLIGLFFAASIFKWVFANLHIWLDF
jgi:hypothetical protein